MSATTFSVAYTMRGFECGLTITDDDAAECMRRASLALDWLQTNGATGAPEPMQASTDAPPVAVAAGNANGHAPTCPTHGTAMKPSKHGGWYCTAKIADDDGTGKPVYCKQKA